MNLHNLKPWRDKTGSNPACTRIILFRSARCPETPQKRDTWKMRSAWILVINLRRCSYVFSSQECSQSYWWTQTDENPAGTGQHAPSWTILAQVGQFDVHLRVRIFWRSSLPLWRAETPCLFYLSDHTKAHDARKRRSAVRIEVSNLMRWTFAQVLWTGKSCFSQGNFRAPKCL